MKINLRDGDREMSIECADGEQNAVQELLFGITSVEFFPSRPVPSRFGTPSRTLASGFGTVGTLPSYPVGTPSVPVVPVEAYTVPPSVPPSRERPSSVRWPWIAVLMGVSIGLCVWSVRRSPFPLPAPPGPQKIAPIPKSYVPKFSPPKNVQP